MADCGLTGVEFATGTCAPHVDLQRLPDSAEERKALLAQLQERGLTRTTLNCSRNPLHPGASGPAHDAVARQTLRLAGILEVDRVVMSGLPGGPGDAKPNWITVSWLPETTRIVEWQGKSG